jgi:pimaricinolide synthase PimS1
MKRSGISPLSLERGLSLFDAAVARPEAALAPVSLDLERMRRELADGAVPSLLRGLIRGSVRRAKAAASDASALRQRLAKLPEASHGKLVSGLVREAVAAALGIASAEAVPADQPLKDLGLDSLMALEVRSQVSALAEKKLPATLLFDYPTADAIASLILQTLEAKRAPVWSDAEVRAKLSKVSIAALAQLGLLESLMAQPDEQIVTAQPAQLDELEQLDHASALAVLDGLLE